MNPSTDSDALPRVLCVDDEPNLLLAMERSLFDRFDVTTAPSGYAALDLIDSEPPFAVVVSDMRMPGMDGAEFLSRVREKSPQTTRILLTGYADSASAIAAVNKGAIFKFLSKPCPVDVLIETLEQGAAKYLTAETERRLLETTLLSLIKLLSEVMAMSAPRAFRRASFIQACVREALPHLKWVDAWQYEAAAGLSQIGYIGAASESRDTSEMRREAAETAYRMLAAIPRLESVASMIRYQWQPAPDDIAPEVAQGAELLRAALNVEHLVRTLPPPIHIDRELAHVSPPIAPEIIESLARFRWRFDLQRREKITHLQSGSLLDEDLKTKAGVLVLSSGHELTEAAIFTLRRLLAADAIEDSVLVRYPQRSEAGSSA